MCYIVWYSYCTYVPYYVEHSGGTMYNILYSVYYVVHSIFSVCIYTCSIVIVNGTNTYSMVQSVHRMWLFSTLFEYVRMFEYGGAYD